MNNTLPNELIDLFQLNVNKYNTRNMEKGGLQVPKINKVCYGERTLRYTVSTLWNEFIKHNDYINFNNHKQFKKYLKKNTLETYNI